MNIAAGYIGMEINKKLSDWGYNLLIEYVEPGIEIINIPISDYESNTELRSQVLDLLLNHWDSGSGTNWCLEMITYPTQVPGSGTVIDEVYCSIREVQSFC